MTILFQNREQCCGCEACAQKCPQQCISLKGDKEGFLYPSINQKKCIECGLCVSVCPFHNSFAPKNPQNAFAAINRNENIRRDSSSGGVFSALANSVLVDGGVVFGAMFDENWNVVHGFIEKNDELSKLRGSKYVQSRIGKCYEVAERFLKDNRRVLFSGTPCQIAALKKFLGKDYDKLITVDFICHGVPSPKLWRWYFDLVKKRGSIVSINFRNKDNGWKRYNFAVDYVQNNVSIRAFHREDPYMIAFLDDMSLRPSCNNCQAKAGRSQSDITLADFWNVDKVVDGIDDDKGVSLLLGNTANGVMLLESVQDLECHEVDFANAIQFNKAWEESYPMSPNRVRFFSSYHNYGKNFAEFVKMSPMQKTGLLKRIKRGVKHLLNVQKQ